MKSYLSIAARLSFFLLAGALAGCGSSGGPPPHVDSGAKDRADMGTVMPHPDGGVIDAGDASTVITCGANGPTLALSDACSCDAECGSSHCVEGVCCNTSCSGGCQTCKAPGSPGTCLARAAKSPPRKASDCPTDSAASCGMDGTCDGAGACRYYFGNTCVGGTCSGDSVLGAFACDGTGVCKAGVTQMLCIPYRCDTNTGACFTSCTSAQGGQCDSQHSCDLSTGSCGKVGIGAHCAGDADCISGNCADNVCCNIACKGACVACNLPGRLGACSAIDAGKPDPRTVCKDQGAASCGHNGTCDGVGGCANYARDTQCLEPSCTGNRLNTAGTCDGLGRCRAPGVQDCHPFRCINGACTKSCQTVTDCDQGTACLPGTTGTMTCGPKPPGASCQAASECSSNFCVDGVCCQSACSGTCQYCALPTSPGFCMTVAADNVDPRGVCQDKGAASCGTNGKCDGTGSCETYPHGTVCASQTCVSGVFTAASTCNTTGQCVAPDSRACVPFVCNGSECFNACGTNDQCKPPNTCNAMNSCGLKGQGAVCSSSIECQIGLSCAQGYCCNSPCGGACQSCALPNTLGTCTNVPVNQVDPAGQCVDKLAASCNTNGKCDGNGSCQLYVQGTACLGSACPGGTSTFTGTSTCDGAGKCVTPNAAPCFPYQCGTNVCKNSCTADADCASPAVCNPSGSCGLKPPGQACVTAAECTSGFCSQSVCCATACTGACQSCALTTAPGTCSNVPNGTADPQGTCHDQGNTTCGTDGFCDGSGACRLYAGGTACAAPSCPASGTTLTSGRTCDGKGTCQAASTIPCAPYACNGTTACKAACAVDADCQTPTYICDPKTGLCGTKHRLGQSCAVSSDCLTGNSCVDGVCCSATACATCQACNLTGSAGNCANVPASSLEPHGLCATSPPCGNTGACDGAGKCQLGGTGVSCGTASCSGSTFTPISHCSGTGACAAPVSSTCPGGFVCDSTNAACKTSCTVDNDCVGPLTCQGTGSTKSCALKPNGQTCGSANQCISGFCTDGVCCGSGPCGTCKACNVNGSGSCAPIPSGTTAPTGQCGANGTCGNTGTCNGSGACTQTASTVSCAAASCTGTTFTPTAFCSGGGSCSAATTSSCAPYVCGSTSCMTTCNVDGDCVPFGGNNSYCTGTGGACVPIKAIGVACFSNHECGSGNCVDGVCCGTASCPTCQSCSVTGSAGTCANVANTVTEPHARCGANGTCGNTGTCNGSGACTQAASNVSCAAASCSGTTFTPTAFCSGSGTCSTPTNASCAPYICGGTSCNNSCSSDAQCVASGGNNTYCTGTNGSCLPVKSLGVACLSNHECGSGNCVDGVCCSTASCGTCMACNVGSSPGTCANVANTVTEPHARCAANGTCGNTGTCNGAGACTQAGTSVTCAPASCSGTTFTPVAFCNGAGACSAPSTSSCSPYLCSGSTCSNACSADTDCVNTTSNHNYCTGTNGSCLPVKSNSVACLSNHECGSNFCVDGVCCASNSCGTCLACNVSGSLGSCANVANNITDPHARCTPGGTCGNTGACNGSGACQQQPTTVMCSDPSCSMGTATLASFCSGAGSCPAAATAPCGEYVCGGTSCKVSCTADTDCIGGDYCTAGACKTRKAPGATCTVNNECGSGFCTEGVCCNKSACGTCESCNLDSTSAGACTPIPSGQTAPSGQCTVGATCGNTGLCNGASGCQLRASGTSCGTASCLANSSQFTAAPACNGTGSCVTPSAISCGSGTLKCNATGCPTSCAVDGDCVSGYYCNGSGVCLAQQSTGTCTRDGQCTTGHYCDGTGNCAAQQSTGSCTAANQCSTGNCTNGFCCDVSACPTCQACDASGSCTALPVSTICASSCDSNGSSLTQTFCDSGACSGAKVVTPCPTNMCDGTLAGCL